MVIFKIQSALRTEVHAFLQNSILDKNVRVKARCEIGTSEESANAEYRSSLSSGITLIGKGTTIPAQTCIGNSCLIYPDLTLADFPDRKIPPGTTLYRRE